jgi:type I restriction enzyme S subunit
LQKRKFNGQDVSYPSDERLPDGWEWATLLESSLVVVDCHNKTAPYVESGIPLVRTSNIKKGVLHLDDLKYVTEETYEKWARRCPPEPGDILFTREAPIGEAAIIPSGVQLCMGQRMMLIRPVHDLISRQYLLLVLLAPGLLERSPIKQKGSTVKHLRVGDVESIIVPVPPREEQDRIVEKTEEILPLCDSLESQLEQRQTVGSDLMDAVLRPKTATPAVAN